MEWKKRASGGEVSHLESGLQARVALRASEQLTPAVYSKDAHFGFLLLTTHHPKFTLEKKGQTRGGDPLHPLASGALALTGCEGNR